MAAFCLAAQRYFGDFRDTCVDRASTSFGSAYRGHDANLKDALLWKLKTTERKLNGHDHNIFRNLKEKEEELLRGYYLAKIARLLLCMLDLSNWYELWKPNLRSMMECDMKAVSIGTKRKSEVLDTCLQQMKACFLDARVNKVKLLNAMAIFFNRSNRSGRDEQRNSGEIVRLCGACSESNMLLRRKPCRNVVWLPGSISEAAVTPQACNSCGPGPVFMIQFKFRQMEIPPNYDVNHLGCIGGCDEILRQLTEICGTGSRNLSSTPASTARGQRTTGNAQGVGTRHTVCIYCRQTGHSSDVCPSQNLQPRNIQPHSRNSQNAASGEASVPCSTCGVPCSVRTANTENNRGRRFYSCRECNFFL
ncbi:hypothetical protein Sjap_018369 [Stephania japonica]|uniref:DNA topoisomerase n=1 Tax=Stephania japonica TaxID=461633 RepID=A0AAP0I7V5_9MAGN